MMKNCFIFLLSSMSIGPVLDYRIDHDVLSPGDTVELDGGDAHYKVVASGTSPLDNFRWTWSRMFLVLIPLVVWFPLSGRATVKSNKMNEETEYFVWKLDGIDAYASPDLNSEPVDMLYYGDDVEILEILHHKTEEVTLRQTNNPSANGELYTHTAKWVKVSYLEDVFYVLDTYLVAYEPPLEEEYFAFVFEHYLEYLSPVVSSKEEGKTADFCGRRMFAYENGVQLVLTDFGPCEQCGHVRNELYFPNLDVREGLVMTLLFVDMMARCKDEKLTIYYKRYPIPTIEMSLEYGMEMELKVGQHLKGVQIVIDMYM